MRIKEKRFSVPFCALGDGLTPLQTILLVTLFSRANFSGQVCLSYQELGIISGIKRKNTMSECLKVLEKRGWIFNRKRSNRGAQIIWLQVPPRFRAKYRSQKGDNIIQEVPFR